MGLAFMLMLVIVVIAVAFSPVPAADIAAAVAPTPNGRALVARFVERSRRFRLVGGLLGVAAVMVVSAATAEEGSTAITIALVPALAGAMVGSILAEFFRARRPSGTRTASLEVRDTSRYSDETADRREIVIGAITAGIATVAAMSGSWDAVALTAVVPALALVRRWVQHRIAIRPRPAVDEALAAADDEVRRMAVRHGIARPMVTLMALAASGAAALAQEPFDEVSWTAQILGFAALGLAITGVVWWWKNRNFGFGTSDRGRYAWVGVVVLVFVALALTFLVRWVV